MAHPTAVTTEWEALAEAAHTEHEITPAMRRVAYALEEAGLAVTFLDGILWADDADTDPDTGIADGTTFRVEQVN